MAVIVVLMSSFLLHCGLATAPTTIRPHQVPYLGTTFGNSFSGQHVFLNDPENNLEHCLIFEAKFTNEYLDIEHYPRCAQYSRAPGNIESQSTTSYTNCGIAAKVNETNTILKFKSGNRFNEERVFFTITAPGKLRGDETSIQDVGISEKYFKVRPSTYCHTEFGVPEDSGSSEPTTGTTVEPDSLL
jgi:hypothetical protein